VPVDAVVRVDLVDVGIPLFHLAGDFRTPVQVFGVLAAYLFDIPR
jgi:hypothetical protein